MFLCVLWRGGVRWVREDIILEDEQNLGLRLAAARSGPVDQGSKLANQYFSIKIASISWVFSLNEKQSFACFTYVNLHNNPVMGVLELFPCNNQETECTGVPKHLASKWGNQDCTQAILI